MKTAMRQKISIGSYIKSTDNVNRDATVIKAICSMGLLIKMNRMISAASSKGVYYISYFYRCVDYNQQETAKWKEVAPKAKD